MGKVGNKNFELIYHSMAMDNIGSNNIVDILEKSRKFNSKNNLTGCLLYHKGEFVQILEGEKQVVQKLFKKIEIDSRHTHVNLVYEGHIDKKVFNNWSMAFKELSDIDMKKLKGHLCLDEFVRLIHVIDKPTVAKKLFAFITHDILK